ncbi:MAG: exodeoxyribonuclease III [Porphyromonadaceae bacterium]|nr:exodeoxyribonuclease III [Porphyromonadaceae bacterium]
MKIISYNVNGLRAAIAKGLLEWLEQASPDVVCLQETKLQPDQIDAESFARLGYHVTLHSAERKGYSGVALLSKCKPDYVSCGITDQEFDCEGRMIRADFGSRTVISVYHPSGSSGVERIAYKMRFHRAWQHYIEQLSRERDQLIICGDFNIAHQPIDIHDPIRNAKVSGFLPEERAWLTEFLSDGYIDAWRYLNPDLRAYSWWTYRANARANNKGWRIDYCLISANLLPRLISARLLAEVAYSDHCPLEVVLQQ